LIATLARRAAAVVAFLALWELVCRTGWISPIILAPPSAIYAAFLDSGREFIAAFWVTAGEIAIAIAIAWPLGVITGLVLGSAPYMAAIFGPVFAAFFAIPLITWYPLLMIWVGIGSASKISYAVISGFFPIVLNTLNGVRHVDRHWMRFGASIGCSRPQILFQILLPLGLPAILSGLRIGTALIVIGVIVTEMLASLRGLGFWITYHRTLYDTGHVYLGILLSLLCVLIVNLGLGRLEARYGAWRDS
jgi:NitT/TauT family transport system permease protein